MFIYMCAITPLGLDIEGGALCEGYIDKVVNRIAC